MAGIDLPQDRQPPTEYISTFGVDPQPELGIPFSLLHYALAIAMIVRERMQRSGIAKSPGMISFYGNDLSRLGVKMAHDLGGYDKVPDALRVAFEENDHQDKDKILRARDELILLAKKRVTAIMAGGAYLPTLGEHTNTVGSLIEYVRTRPELKDSILNFMDAVVTHINDSDTHLGGACDYTTVRETITSLLPPRYLNDPEDKKLKNGMYGPLQAAATAAFIEQGAAYVTYKGAATISRSYFGDKTLHDMTRFLSAEVALKLLNKPELSRRIADPNIFIIDSRADGLGFSSGKASVTDPFYVGDGSGAGTDSGPDTKIPWVNSNMELALNAEWWNAKVGTGPLCTIVNGGARKAVLKLIDPLLCDFLAGGDPSATRRLGVLVRSSNSPLDTQNIVDAARRRIEGFSLENGGSNELLPYGPSHYRGFAYRDLTVTLAAVIAEEAQSKYNALLSSEKQR